MLVAGLGEMPIIVGLIRGALRDPKFGTRDRELIENGLQAGSGEVDERADLGRDQPGLRGRPGAPVAAR
jgi:hypothetical protein